MHSFSIIIMSSASALILSSMCYGLYVPSLICCSCFNWDYISLYLGSSLMKPYTSFSKLLVVLLERLICSATVIMSNESNFLLADLKLYKFEVLRLYFEVGDPGCDIDLLWLLNISELVTELLLLLTNGNSKHIIFALMKYSHSSYVSSGATSSSELEDSIVRLLFYLALNFLPVLNFGFRRALLALENLRVSTWFVYTGIGVFFITVSTFSF